MALSKERDTKEVAGVNREFPVAADAVIHAGGLVALNSSGFLVPGSVATTLKAVGRAEKSVNNTDGANGAVTAPVKRGVFNYKNSTSTDAIALADVGSNCYIVDDETVAKTDGSSARSVAGKVYNVDSHGVWVEF